MGDGKSANGVADGLRPQVSIITPMHNEMGAAEALVREIVEAAAELDSYEIIAVNDGSTDETAHVLQALRKTTPELRILTHAKAGGQSAAVHSGVLAAKADICCTLDGDGQNPPSELPKLWNILLEDEARAIGLVAGQRKGRKDTFAKRYASIAANKIRGAILKDGTRDTGCGLKGFRRSRFLELPYFDHMHRYLPALFNGHGWAVAHVDVAHRSRETGESKYNNLNRAIVGVSDMFGVVWLIRRRKKASAARED